MRQKAFLAVLLTYSVLSVACDSDDQITLVPVPEMGEFFESEASFSFSSPKFPHSLTDTNFTWSCTPATLHVDVGEQVRWNSQQYVYTVRAGFPTLLPFEDISLFEIRAIWYGLYPGDGFEFSPETMDQLMESEPDAHNLVLDLFLTPNQDYAYTSYSTNDATLEVGARDSNAKSGWSLMRTTMDCSETSPPPLLLDFEYDGYLVTSNYGVTDSIYVDLKLDSFLIPWRK